MTHNHHWHDDLRWNHAFETCGCGATRILVEDDEITASTKAEDELKHPLSELDLLSDNWHRRYMNMPDGHTQKRYGKVIDEFITELNAIIIDAEERKAER